MTRTIKIASMGPLLFSAVLVLPSWQGSRLPAQETTEGGEAGNGETQPAAARTLPGFADTPWCAGFSEVKEKLKNLATSGASVERIQRAKQRSSWSCPTGFAR